ncbi:hypothetical protein F5883DRAFT_118673 [Diaporthe sp. PMI_573]|nr:hypothetical protein F5883DRAFT_118673 [Diaporthaceae sp. PMI_573]
MLGKSQYSPTSNPPGCGGCEGVSSLGVWSSGDRDDVAATLVAVDASLMLWTIACTSASVGAVVSSCRSWWEAWGAWCPFGVVVPFIFLSPCCCSLLRRETLTEGVAAEELGSPSLGPTLRPRRLGARRCGVGGTVKDAVPCWVKPSAGGVCTRRYSPSFRATRYLPVHNPSAPRKLLPGTCPRRVQPGSQPPRCLKHKNDSPTTEKKPTHSHRTDPNGPMRILIVAHLMEQAYQDATRAAC